MILSLAWLARRSCSRKEASSVPSYMIVPYRPESKLVVPASSQLRVHRITGTMSSIRGCKRRDHEVIVMHVTVMYSNKKTCVY